MNLFSRIAWRNVTRNKRRTIITLAAVSSGLAAIIIFFGLSNGFHDQWITNSVRVYSGHIVIFADEYREERDLNRTIGNPDELVSRLEGLPGMQTATARIHINGLISTPRNSTVALIRGIDTERETLVTGLADRMTEGEYLDADGSRQILLGYKLAERLSAELGEKIVLMVQAADGSIGAELFRLHGVFRLGAIDLDRSLAIIRLEDAQDLAVLGDTVTEEVLILDSPADAGPMAAQLSEELRDENYEVMTWDEVLPQAREMIALSNIFTYILLIIILTVVALGILNTMLMSIMERTREFGIMRALGTRPAQIVRIVLLEATFLGLIGSLLGIMGGAVLVGLLNVQGIDLSRWSGAMDLVSSLKPVIFPTMQPGKVIIAALAAFIATLAASIYPAVRAARLRPVDAIRAI